MFYASINAGSMLSTLVTPILREEVECFEREGTRSYIEFIELCEYYLVT